MRSVAGTLILIASTLLAVVLPLTAASAAGCSTPFGSLPKDDPAMGTGEVDTMRAGRHECFDRLAVDIDGPPAGGAQGANVPSTSRRATTHRPGRRATRDRPAVGVEGGTRASARWAMPGRGGRHATSIMRNNHPTSESQPCEDRGFPNARSRRRIDLSCNGFTHG